MKIDPNKFLKSNY